MYRLTFLGTSSGVPTKHRNVSALAVEMVADARRDQPWLLFDCGEGTQQQLLKSHLSTRTLGTLIISHVHGDHCYGLAGLLASLSLRGRKAPLRIIAPRAIKELLVAYEQLTDLHLSYELDFVAVEDLVQAPPFDLGVCGQRVSLEVLPLSHRVPSFGFVLRQSIVRSKLDTHKLVRDGITNVHWAMIKKSFDAGITHISIADRSIRTKAYVNSVQRLCTVILAGDNDSPELLTPWLDKADALVHEATYGCAMKQKIVARHQAGSGFDPMHASVQEVATVAKRCALPTLILTHFSARYDVIDDPTSQSTNMGHLRQEAEHCYDGKLILAKDFLCVEIDGAVATVTDAGPDVRIIDA